MFRLLIFVAFLQAVLPDSIGLCDLDAEPTTWATTSAIGIPKVAHRGVPLGGVNYCIEQTKANDSVKIAYHLDTENSISESIQEKRIVEGIFDANNNTNNYCVVKDPRVLYCIPFCSGAWQPQVIGAALQSSLSEEVADILFKEFGQPGWAISVLAVDYNNPLTHLNLTQWSDFSIWCSVYVGIKPNRGFDYLYEIQMAKVIV